MLSGAPFYTPWIGLEGIKREGPGPSEGLKIRWGPVVLGGDNVAPLVEIGLTDLLKYGGVMAPQNFGRSVNPISTKGGRLCPPNNTGTPGFSDLPTALVIKEQSFFSRKPNTINKVIFLFLLSGKKHYKIHTLHDSIKKNCNLD